MQTKTYFASSVPAALDTARKELGTDAMLLNSRPAPAESKAFGRLEVTFAYEPRSSGEAFRTESPIGRSAPKAVRQQGPARVESTELDELKRQVEALRVAVVGAPSARSARPSRDGEGSLAAKLIRNGVSEALAGDLVATAQESGVTLADAIAARIPETPFVPLAPGESRSLAFIGPAGRGKTTSLVKIALKFGIARGVPVRICQAGGHGVGSQEQLARYAAILGVPFWACESLDSLHLSLGGDVWKGLVLIDTPGISPSKTAALDQLARLFSHHPEIERHLVLRADTRSADMTYVVSRYSVLGPARLLFTGVEETLTTGAMAETLMTTGLGAAFSGTGQTIPDDIEELDIARLARSVCGDRALAAASGA